MQISAAPLIYILIFVAVVVMVQGIYLAVFGKSISLDNRVSRRLQLMQKNGNREQVLEQLRKEMSQHLAARGIPFYSLLATKAQRANIAFTPRQLILIMVVMTLVAYVGLAIGTAATPPVRALLSVGIGVGGVFFWVSSKAKKRMKLMEDQLADAIELMVRSLRVGHPFASAIAIVAKEVPDPLGTEFGIIADEAAYGRNVAESLKAFAERLDNQDLRFLAVAVTIQQQSGGNLAEILNGLSKVIRARYKLFRRVAAITAEARFSGIFLSSFPFLALLAILSIKPDYYDEVQQSPMFMIACVAVAVMLIVNIIYMKILTNIKV